MIGHEEVPKVADERSVVFVVVPVTRCPFFATASTTTVWRSVSKSLTPEEMPPLSPTKYL